MNRIIQFILTHPKAFVGLSLISLLISIPGLLSLKQDYSYRHWFNETDTLLIQEDQFQDDFGSIDSLTILINFNNTIFEPNNLDTIKKLTSKLSLLPYALRVDSLANYDLTHAEEEEILIEELFSLEDPDKIRDAAIKDPILLENYLFNLNHATTLSFRFHHKKQNGFYKKVINDIENIFNTSNIKGLESYRLLGNPKISTAFKEVAIKDLKILIPTLLLLVLLLIYFQFRSFKIVIWSLLTICLSILLMLGFSSYLGFTFNNLTSITPELILAIGLADAVHIISTFKLKRASLSTFEAIKYSLEKNYFPTIITSLTTACGFFSFFNSNVDNIRDMGIVAGLGTIFAWLTTYFFLAPLLLITLKTPQKNYKMFKVPKWDSKKFIDKLIKNKKYVYIAYCVLISVSVFSVSQIKINSDPLKYFRGDLDLATDMHKAQSIMKGIFPLELVFEAKNNQNIKEPDFLNKVDSFIAELKLTNTVFQDFSAIKILKNMNKVFHEGREEYYKIPNSREEIAQLLFTYNLSVPPGRNLNDRISLNEKKLRVTFMMKHMDSVNGDKFYSYVQNLAKKRELDLSIAGKRYLWHSLNLKVVESFINSLGLALLLVTILLSIFFKSIRIGLLSLIPNLIPIITSAIFLAITARSLDIGTSIVASIVLGIAVDDTIHVIANYKKYLLLTDSPRNALIALFNETAPALIITSLILSISFACFLLASFVPNQNMGVLLSLSLIFALICDLTLLPLLLFDFVKRKNL